MSALAGEKIKSRLEAIDSLHHEALKDSRDVSGDMAFMLGRLAVVEFCCWIEFALDAIVRQTMQGAEGAYADHEAVIKKVSGFDYKSDFRHMFKTINGAAETDAFEKIVGEADKSALIGQLSTMKKYRDLAAHEWGDGANPRLLAPSEVVSRFKAVYSILQRLFVAAGLVARRRLKRK